MTLTDIILSGLIAALGTALAYLYLLFAKERNEISHSLRDFRKRFGVKGTETNKIQALENKFQDLEARVQGLSGQSGKKITPKGWKDQEKDNRESEYIGPAVTERAEEGYVCIPETRAKGGIGEEQPDPTNPSEKRLWVEKTLDGLMRLQKTDKPKGIYLVEANKKYQLHLANMDPGLLANFTILYKDILEFPAGYSSVSSLEMEEHPVYEKQNEFYLFRKKGKIKINQ